MPPALYTSPYANFELSLDEKEQLHATAEGLVDEIQQLYESYLWNDNLTLDSTRWSLVRERDDVRVFQDLRPPAHKDLYHLLTIGSVNGTLNDAMYGELNHTTDAMRIKTAYVKDTLLDCAVLETILEPTEENPFQSMTVRWFVKAVPLFVRVVSKHRDNVYLEAVGMRQLSNGEDVGFRLMHSITSGQTPLLPDYDRSNLSICTLWRQQKPQSVQVFQTTYVEINESRFIVPMAIKSVSEALISVYRVLDCAQLKKLTSLVQSKPSFLRNESTTVGEGCTVCGAQSPCTRRGVKSTCAICSRITCGRCRVKREIVTVGLDRRLLQLKMRFCTPCLSSTTRLDAFGVAVNDVREGKSQQTSAFTRTATSSSSASYSVASSISSSISSSSS